MDRLNHEKTVGSGDIAQDTVAAHENRWRTLPDGRVTFSQVFTVAILFVVGIQGLKFIGPWYDYLRFKGAMQESVNQAPLLTNGDMINAVMAKAKESGCLLHRGISMSNGAGRAAFTCGLHTT
jgi:hypothetical protein